MKIRKIKKLKVNSTTFTVVWNKSHNGGIVDYATKIIEIGTNGNSTERILEVICHELFEVCALEAYVRFDRMDVDSDYLFVFDHRQYTSMMSMFSSLVSQFIL